MVVLIMGGLVLVVACAALRVGGSEIPTVVAGGAALVWAAIVVAYAVASRARVWPSRGHF